MKTDHIEKEKRRQLKKHLPQGSIKKIAKQTGMSEQSIAKILDGQWNNQMVLDAAIKVLEEHLKGASEVIRYFEEEN